MRIQRQIAITLSAILLVIGHLLPAVADSSAAPSETLVTCINFNSGKESISKLGTCLSNQAIAKWQLAKSDTPIPSGPGSKLLIVCSNQESSTFAFRLIRSDCPKHQVKSVYSRKAGIPSAPKIVDVVAYSDVSAAISLISNSSGNPDAPIAYYTVSISNGESRKVKSSSDLRLAIGGLKASTTYTFMVTATNADGTSAASTPSDSVTTKEYVPPVVVVPASTPVALTCATGGTCVVGDVGPGGGNIYFVSVSGFNCGTDYTSTGSPTGGLCNYLEVAPSGWSISENYTWATQSNTNNMVPGIVNRPGAFNDFAGVGLGYKNSIAIATFDTSVSEPIAAVAARSYSGGGKNDWYLPTFAELNLLCKWVRGLQPSVTSTCSGGTLNSATYGAGSASFAAVNYWTSEANTSTPNTTAYSLSFGGSIHYMESFFRGKLSNTIRVRPIRAF
jgi:hypothetical protein